MKGEIPAGATFTRTFTVDRTRVIDFMGPEIRVYATPAMIHDIEVTCRDWLLTYLGEGEDSVGARVEIAHERPTPLGMAVTHSVQVGAVAGRRVSFEITVRDAVEEVAHARHDRVVVATARLAAAVRRKGERKEGR
jgi:fluoroacetyl-CoA thioesterase